MTVNGLYLVVSQRYSEAIVASIMVASVCYLSLLSLFNAQGILTASPLIIGVTELFIYGACLYVLRNSIRTLFLGALCGILAWLCLAWICRGEIDPKGLRDLLIPILFLSLGQHVANTAFADRIIKSLLLIVVFFGALEVFFLDLYANIFNTFRFYVNTGATPEDRAMFEDQMLTLNGFRPEGIGRTILPMVFGQHRASSLLMEPVSMGNFAVLILAYGLSKDFSEWRKGAMFFWGAAILIALSDSRFGLMMLVPMLLLRILPAVQANRVAVFFPLLGVLVLFYVALMMPAQGDNLVGRLTRSGVEMLELPGLMWFGLSSPLPNFGDMGYAYAMSRFGLPLCTFLLIGLMWLPMPDQRAMRFRAFVLLYASAILLISGTSLFALKTAGLLWFMLGVLSADRGEKTGPGQISNLMPGVMLRGSTRI